MEKQKRENRIDFRVNNCELDKIKSNSNKVNLTVSDFCRKSALSFNVEYSPFLNNKKDIAIQVKRVGVNLNEVAYVLNIANLKNALNNYNYQALLNELKFMENQLNKIIVGA
jgi:hypothetical protein